jgi:hypothetical protein
MNVFMRRPWFAGGTVTYELAAGSSTFFQIDASTAEVSVSAAGGLLVSVGSDRAGARRTGLFELAERQPMRVVHWRSA